MKNNKKTNKLTRTVTTAIAAVMMLSTAASFSAYADSTDAVVHMNTCEALNSTTGEQLDEAAKNLSKAIINGGIDYFAGCVPGGKVVSAPLKKLVDYIYGGKSAADPIQDLIKLEQTHFDQLSEMIQTLDKNMAMYADMLSKKIDTATGAQTLGQVFIDLSNNLCTLIDRVNAIVEDDHYTPEQKLILLADINDDKASGGQYLVRVRQDSDALSKTMNYDGSVLVVDFYGTLMELAKPGCMFYDEALAKARGYAQQLTRQYISARGVKLNEEGAQYVVVSDKVTDTKGARNGEIQSIVHYKDGSFDVITTPLYNYTSTIKIIDVDDPDLKVIDLPIKTYRADNKNISKYNIKEIKNNFCFFFRRDEPIPTIDPMPDPDFPDRKIIPIIDKLV